MTYFAHSKNKAGCKHPLAQHLESVSRMAGEFAEALGFKEEAELAGLLHDLAKYGDRFQKRLEGQDQGLDHWSMGAWLALIEHRAVAAALAIQGHHVGLQCLRPSDLANLAPAKLRQSHPLQLSLTEADPAVLKARLAADGLTPRTPEQPMLGAERHGGFPPMLDIRLLFSALTDADFLDTEAHFEGGPHGKNRRPPGPPLQAALALEILLTHVEKLGRASKADHPVAEVRGLLRADCLAAAELPPGLFTLTAPTGSGKTLSMLAFALAHAERHGLRRIVLVVPYLSIIEQTAAVYRNLFQPHFGKEYVLEHHSLAGLGGKESSATDAEGENGESDERRRRLLSENWDAPLIVTTSVQMLESLFSNRPSACRKLHRLAQSVILFDEVQTLPAPLAVPTLASLSHLAEAHRGSVVFATATQPAFEHLHDAVRRHAPSGWQPRGIVSRPERLFAPLRRVKRTWGDPDQPLSWADLACHLRALPQVLCIVNLKRHSRKLWEALDDPESFHLSTNLCPAHRQALLAAVRARLAASQAVRLVATQCVEAGVDLDFPKVFRAFGPLEAIIQAEGRCNREGRLPGLGELRVFMLEADGSRQYPPGGYEQAAQVTQMLLKRYGPEGMRLDDPDFIAAYYRELYDIAKPEEAGKTKTLVELVNAGDFPEIAKQYRLIENDTINVIVPYPDAMALFDEISRMAERDGLTGALIRKARPLAVSLFRPKQDSTVWDSLLEVQSFKKGRRARQAEWFIAAKPEHYHPQLGLMLPEGLNLWIA